MKAAGAILAGGQSRRMGRTKALIDIDGIAMASRVAAALTAGGCDDIVLIGGDADELGSLALPVVADLYPGDGPLGGVLTALRHFDDRRDVIVVACDLPALDAGAVRSMLDAAARNRKADVVVAMTDQLQPMLAVWRPASSDAVNGVFTAGTRSLHKAIEGLTSVEVAVDPRLLLNVNRPDDVPDH